MSGPHLRPRSCIAGYVRTRDGETLVFGILADRFITRWSEVTAVQNVPVAALAATEWRTR